MGAWQTVADNNNAFVDGLKKNHVVKDPEVEAVLRRVDRIHYCRHPSDAYVDSPQSIGDGQTISAPHMHAAALEILKPNLHPGASVLDVGSGSGYLAACFARMIGSGRVTGIEVNQRLVDWSRQNVKKADGDLLDSGLLEIVVGDGWRGWPAHAPYDAIHVGAAAESVPVALVEQLKPGGRMVIPVGRSSQELLLVWKDQNGKVDSKHLMGVRYVPLVKPPDVKV
jgi:protein-L-isoaspartate(D-aspartate) O-methyltransferase